MLGPSWEEGKSLHATGSTYITGTDFGLDALLVVLNARHGRQRHVPRTLSLEMLARVAVVVDYYQCHGVVDMAKELWINALKPYFPRTHTISVISWIWVAWVFSAEEEFKLATSIAIQQCPGLFFLWGFPIPSAVISELNGKIDAAMNSVYTALDQLLMRFRDERPACSFKCNVMLSGVLSFAIEAKHLTKGDQRPLNPENDSSFGLSYQPKRTFEAMIQTLRTIEQEEPQTPRLHSPYDYGTSKCSLRSYIRSLIDDAQGRVTGLSLSTFDIHE